MQRERIAFETADLV